MADDDTDNEWLDRYAAALGVAGLTAPDRDALLDLARIVAHRTVRANAPLATYLAGCAAALGVDPITALVTAEACFETGAPGR